MVCYLLSHCDDICNIFNLNCCLFLFLAPNGTYGVKDNYCDDIRNCWQIIDYFNDTVLNDDLDETNAAIGYWNDTLFIIGNEMIHYAQFDIFGQSEPIWNQIEYEHGYSMDMNMISQQYAQYQSTLFVFGYNLNHSAANLLYFDLDTLEMDIIGDINDTFIDSDPFKSCIVTDGVNVYFILEDGLYKYDSEENGFNILQEFDTKMKGAACAMTNDLERIYLFGGETGSRQTEVTRYNIPNDELTDLESRIPYYFYNARAITAQNGYIYIYAYLYGDMENVAEITEYFVSKQLIFDPELEQFEAKRLEFKDDLPDFEWTLQWTDYIANPNDEDMEEAVIRRIKETLTVLFQLPEFQTV